LVALAPFGETDAVTAVGPPDGLYGAVEFHRQLEGTRVVGQIGNDVVAAGVAVCVSGDREPRQAVVATRGEQPQRVPARPPRRRRRLGCLQDRETPTLLLEEV